jgi:hypothetical protein
MEEIVKYKIAPATKSYVNKNIIYSIGGFFLVLIGGILAYLFTQIDYSLQGSITISSILPKLNSDWSLLGNTTILNIFLIIDTFLGLFLMDKYLQHKKEKLKAKGV